MATKTYKGRGEQADMYVWMELEIRDDGAYEYSEWLTAYTGDSTGGRVTGHWRREGDTLTFTVEHTEWAGWDDDEFFPGMKLGDTWTAVEEGEDLRVGNQLLEREVVSTEDESK
jgi:hypothetical protein